MSTLIYKVSVQTTNALSYEETYKTEQDARARVEAISASIKLPATFIMKEVIPPSSNVQLSEVTVYPDKVVSISYSKVKISD